jgi:MAF protein
LTSLILASNSPRRRDLLSLGGWSFRLRAAQVDESIRAGETPLDYVLRLAKSKAHAAARLAGMEEIVVAADTTVVDGAHILGKPADALEAAAMLRRLRGHKHQVYSALAVLRMHDQLLLSDVCTTEVPMRLYSDEEIETYVASGDPLDKAGAYAIQNRDFKPVLSLSGCFAGVMGLPLCHLDRLLRQMGAAGRADLPHACQAALDYACDVYPQIWT